MTVVTAVAANGVITYVFKGYLNLPFKQQKLASGGYFNRLALVTRKC
jgi:hypothetical protein